MQAIYEHTLFWYLMSTLIYVPKSCNMLMSIVMGILEFGIHIYEGAHEHTGFWYIHERAHERTLFW